MPITLRASGDTREAGNPMGVTSPPKPVLTHTRLTLHDGTRAKDPKPQSLRRARRTLTGDLKTLYRYRELLILWTEREVRVRYKQSFLGGLWAILQPLALMIVFTSVFALIVRIPSDGIPYPLFSYAALLTWTFFSNALSFGIPSLVNNMGIITKIYFPREIFLVATTGAALVDFAVANLVLVPALLWYQVPLTPAVLWVPVILIIEVLLILGVAIPAAALNVFYRDVRFIIPLALQLWMYASPIIYPISLVPDRYQWLYVLNPMVGIVDSYRRVLLQGQAPDPQYLGTSAVVSVALALLGYRYFKHKEGLFADLV